MEDILKLKKLSFVKRPISIPPDYRPMFKLAQLVLILGLCCRSNKSTLLKLHLFSWGLKSVENSNMLKKWVDTNFTSDMEVWSIEPTLNRAIQYALAENLCEKCGSSILLTDKGEIFLMEIKSDDNLLAQEKEWLGYIGKSISDTKIKQLSTKWTEFYVKD